MKKKVVFFIILLFIFSITLLYFYFSIYSPQKEILTNITKESDKLESEIKKYENTIIHLKKELSSLPVEHVNLNYFNRQNLKDAERAPFFLQLINNLTNALGLKLLKINPGKSEDKGDYSKTSFEVTLQGDYFKLMRFIWKIENDHALNIERLIISHSDYNYNKLSPINALLDINSLDMLKPEESDIETLKELRQQYILSREEEKVIQHPGEIYRNPFIEPSKARYAREQQRKLEESLKGLSVVGIMDLRGQKRALIGGQLFKKGDFLLNQIKVLKIKEDSVILGIHNEEYTLSIESNPVSVRQNARRRLYD